MSSRGIRVGEVLIDLERASRINRSPWTVNPHQPPQHVVDALLRRRMPLGSAQAVLWVEQWRYWLTKKRADMGFEDARAALASGLVEVHGELGDGLPKQSGRIDDGSGLGG